MIVFNVLYLHVAFLISLQEKTVIQALTVVTDKLADVDDAESRALNEVKEYYNTCMEVLRSRMNFLGRFRDIVT